MDHGGVGEDFGEAARLALLDLLPELIVVIDPEARIRWVNRSVTRVLGYEPADVLGEVVFDFLHPDDVAYMLWSWENRRDHPGESGLIVHGRGRDAAGRWRAFAVLGLSLLEVPEIDSLVITMRELDNQDALADSPARLRSMIDRTTDVVMLLDADGRFVFANRRLTAQFGHDHDRVVGQPFATIIAPAARAATEDWIRDLARSGDGSSATLRVDIEDPSGRTHDVELRATNQLGDPVIEGIIVTGRDISEIVGLARQLEQQNERLERAASHDPLTGLRNRPSFLAELEATLATRAVDGGGDVAVLFCDLDGFKQVNDVRGHAVGDLALEAVAGRLVDAVRREDLVARYGGDEFTVLVGPGADAVEVRRIVDRIEAALEEPIVVDGATLHLGVSVGMSRTRAGEDAGADRLLSEADADMYRRKRSRRAADDGAPAQG